jgi:hypothetical protein
VFGMGFFSKMSRKEKVLARKEKLGKKFTDDELNDFISKWSK